MAKIGVYKLVNEQTNKFYVGSSQDVEKRFKRHIRDLNNWSHHCQGLQELWAMFGQLKLEILECETREKAYELEQKIIDEYKDSPLLLNIGLAVIGGDNLTRNARRKEIIGKIQLSVNGWLDSLTPEEKIQIWSRPGNQNGMFGKTHTPEARKKISEGQANRPKKIGYKLKLSDEQRQRLIDRAKSRTGDKNTFYGKKHSEDAKKKMSEIAKNRSYLPGNSRKVVIDDVTYVSLTEASRQLGISPALIVYRLQKPKYENYRYLNA